MKRKLLGLMMAVVVALPVFVNAEGNSVKIGTTEYPTLKEAVEAAPTCAEESCKTTITVVADHTTAGIKFTEGKYIEIDLGGFTVSFKEPTVGSKGTETQDMQILKNSTITFKNGKFVSSNTASSKMFIQNYANLTLKDVEIVAINEGNLYALSNNSGDVSIEGTTSIKAKRVAFDVYGYYAGGYPSGPQVTVDTTGTIEGTIEVAKDSGTATRELSLVVKNMNHIGELSIQEGLEGNVTIEMKDNNLYAYETEEGETKYVVATKDELVDSPYIQDSVSGKEFEEELKELDEMIAEIEENIKEIEAAGEKVPEEALKLKEMFNNLKKLLEGKTILSGHDIVYRSFLDGNLILNLEEKQPSKKVNVTLDIPENLEKVKEGYTRKFSVIRMHMSETENNDGTYTYDYEVVELDATDNGNGKVTFETDKFSTYILTYEDVKIETSTVLPADTFDGISLYMIIASVSLIGLISVVAYGKKVKNY